MDQYVRHQEHNANGLMPPTYPIYVYSNFVSNHTTQGVLMCQETTKIKN